MAKYSKPTKTKSPKASSTKSPTARVYKTKGSAVKAELNFTRFTPKSKTRLT